MKIMGQLQWTDYLNSQLLHLSPVPSVRIVYYSIYAVVVLALSGGIYEAATGQLESPISYLLSPFIIVAMIVAIVPLYRYVLLPRQVKKIFTQQKALNSPFEYEFTETEMILSNEFGNSRIPWENFTRWKENSELIMLYHSDIVYNIIPKRFFFDLQQIETVKSFLGKDKVPTARNSSMVGFIIYIVFIVIIGTMLYFNFSKPIAP